MTKRDYYEVLGVQRDADPERIKAAYRREARRSHPDAHGGDPVQEARFKEVREAYEVLSDADRRRTYDRFGHAGLDGGFASAGERDPSGAAGFEDVFGGRFGSSGFGSGGVFEELFGARRRPGTGGGGGARTGGARGTRSVRGRDLQVELDVDFLSASRGGERRVQYRRQGVCGTCSGSGLRPGTAPSRCSRCDGRGEVQSSPGGFLGREERWTTCPLCAGRGETGVVPCGECGGEGRAQVAESLDVRVPAGALDGARIRVPGKGDVGRRGGAPGDLIAVLKVHPHPHFRAVGRDVYLRLPLTVGEAAAGARVSVPTVDGPMTMSVPPGVRHGQRLRLKEKGLPDPQGGPRGHQYVEVEVVLPAQMSAPAAELLLRFDELTGFDPRRGLWEE